jgi:hypothetical protein
MPVKTDDGYGMIENKGLEYINKLFRGAADEGWNNKRHRCWAGRL